MAECKSFERIEFIDSVFIKFNDDDKFNNNNNNNDNMNQYNSFQIYSNLFISNTLNHNYKINKMQLMIGKKKKRKKLF